MVVLQFITELVIGFNYVFGLICVTPMALLVTSLAAPSAAAGMPMARVLDTALGALVGIAFALVFSTLADRAHLAAHHENDGPAECRGSGRDRHLADLAALEKTRQRAITTGASTVAACLRSSNSSSASGRLRMSKWDNVPHRWPDTGSSMGTL